jgi:copper ion binding protein
MAVERARDAYPDRRSSIHSTGGRMTQTARIEVDGMTCNGCVRSVTNAVTRVPGVQKVDVSLAGKSATVEYDPAATSAAQIVAAIAGAGFGAKAAA